MKNDPAHKVLILDAKISDDKNNMKNDPAHKVLILDAKILISDLITLSII